MRRFAVLALAIACTVPALAQMPTTKPGAADARRVTAGTYQVDPYHTQIVFTVDHLGFNSYWGIFGDATGTLTLDPARPAAATLAITVPMTGLVTTSAKLNEHLAGADFFDVARFPTATFKSTRITVSGTTAKITGDLTLHGVTRPIVLDAKFTGAGKGPMPPHTEIVGFEATTTVRRSDFGVSFGTALVSDLVPLKITAAFEKK